MKKYNIAIVGATGLVGETFLKVLDEYDLPINNLYLYASSRSKGKKITFRNKEYTVIELNEENIIKDIDIALFSAGGETSKNFAPLFAKNNTVVIDNSSYFRMHEDVKLIVPEANKEIITKEDKIIANPNCSTIQVIPVLKVLDDHFNIKRIIYSSYQAVSGAGMKGINDYLNNMKEIDSTHFPYNIFNNVLPHIDSFLDNGYTKEEIKMINETNKILNKNIDITATCVRIPVLNSHSVSVNVEFENDFELEKVFEILKNSENIVLYDDVKNNIYPMPLIANGKDSVFVGRIRRDFSKKNSLNFFVVADNIRKGAASNAVQIAKYMIDKGILL